MQKYQFLKLYKEGANQKSEILDGASKDLKNKIVESLNSFVERFIQNEKTQSNLNTTFDKLIKCEHNVLTVPYFSILENINFCIEVEMSREQSIKESNFKFCEKKFSEILENGINHSEPINRLQYQNRIILNDNQLEKSD